VIEATLLLCIAPILWFLAMAFQTKWRQNLAMRAVVALNVVALILLSMSFARRIGFPPPSWVILPAFVVLAIVLWSQLFIYRRVQARGRQRDEEELRLSEELRRR
jgi:protein-S-isoprenylcysteine O-methyltransferase Ste14